MRSISASQPEPANRQLVVGNHQCPPLGFRQMLQQNDRDLRHAEFPCSENSGVPRDDILIGADQNRIRQAEFLDRRCDGGDLRRAVRARIVRPRDEPFDRPVLALISIRRCYQPISHPVPLPAAFAKHRSFG
jgi:hypothetical protein